MGMVTGVVLSGGTGMRFGCEKGLVRLLSEPMMLPIVRTMQSFAEEVIVAVASGKIGEYSQVLGEDVVLVEDEREGIGPLQGLRSALRAARTEYVVVSPCDTPLLRADVCMTVLGRGMGRDGAVPRVRGYLEPLHASYRREACLHAFERAIAEGKRSPRDAYPFLDLVVVEEEDIKEMDPDLESFMNINTRGDFSRVARLLSSR